MKKIILAVALLFGACEAVDYVMDAPAEGSRYMSGTTADGTQVHFTPEYILDHSKLREGDEFTAYFLPSPYDEGVFVGVKKKK